MIATIGLAGILAAFAGWPCRASGPAQSDWSGGPGAATVVTHWGNEFAAAEGVSWLAVPGQLALSSAVLGEPRTQSLAQGGFWGAESVRAADLDGDGDADVVGAAYSGAVSWWRNDGGRPLRWQRQEIAGGFAGANQIQVADLDGDGRPDVVGAAYLASEVAWWRNQGGTPARWERHVIDGLFWGACSVACFDLDRDGDLDVLATAFEAGVLAWWENSGGGAGPWSRHEIDGDVPHAHEVAVADLDGDGDPDVAAASWDGVRLGWWRNDGGQPPRFSRLVIDASFDGGSSVDLADLDGDGAVDILAAASRRDEVSWWRNEGGDPLRWSKQVIAAWADGAWSVFAADIDGDGRRDAVAAFWNAAQVVWWRHAGGASSSWTRHELSATMAGASAVHAADLDGDGDLEILSAGFEAADLRAWEPTEFVTSGELTSQILDTESGISVPVCRLEGALPAGTSVTVHVRASDAPEDMGEWHDAPSGAVPRVLLGRRFLQYRLSLATPATSSSPIVTGISFEWAPREPRRRIHAGSASP